ncbi:hypothetical protein K1719_045074 [Acacia pycnantha]|nr:hypothetical protein K1719_045074 [Acacia pycnantha]
MIFMDWNSRFIIIFLVVNLSLNVAAAQQDENVSFWQNYGLPWGTAHVQILDQNTQVQLTLDQYTGSAGFKSLQTFGSGWFSMKIKMPQKDSTGVITTFYLRSEENWDEVDFELLGGNGKERPYVVHTNLITNGETGREQQFHLWFDPTADFHNYTILWNSHQLVWFVDNNPVRVFKNNGGSFPRQAVSVIGTIWNGTWASDGALVNWNEGPFAAYYTGFGVNACPTQSINGPHCSYDSTNYWWDAPKYWSLNPDQKKLYHYVRSKYMVYDYCSKHPTIPECHVDP